MHVVELEAEGVRRLFHVLPRLRVLPIVSVLMPFTAGLPKRSSGSMRTGERESSCGRHPAAMSPFHTTRSTNV
jgi:hypothetical protein